MITMVPSPFDDACFCQRHLAAIAANGYNSFPIPPAQKRTYWSGWTKWCRTPPREDQVVRWIAKYGHFGLALACGYTCFAIDIDEEDVGRADALHAIASEKLGTTPLVRYGRAPRRVLIYRVATAPIVSRRLTPTVELIGDRKYVLAHGIHPNHGQPYLWAEEGPETFPLAALPAPDAPALLVFADAAARLCNLSEAPRVAMPRPDVAAVAIGRPTQLPSVRISVTRPDARWVVDANGRICDGREAYLSAQIYLAYRELAPQTDANAIATTAWSRFCATVELTRPRRDGRRPWRHADALSKVHALLKRQPHRAAYSARRRIDAFWTGPVLAGFAHVVDARGAAGALSPTTVAVSHAMLSLVRTSGVCFASPATLAATLGFAKRTVQHARHVLVAEGLWQVANEQGGRGRGAEYRPCPAALATGSTT